MCYFGIKCGFWNVFILLNFVLIMDKNIIIDILNKYVRCVTELRSKIDDMGLRELDDYLMDNRMDYGLCYFLYNNISPKYDSMSIIVDTFMQAARAGGHDISADRHVARIWIDIWAKIMDLEYKKRMILESFELRDRIAKDVIIVLGGNYKLY